MSRKITLDETIEVARPLHEVFAYVSEFSRIEQWDPAVARGTRVRAMDRSNGIGHFGHLGPGDRCERPIHLHHQLPR